MKNIVFSQFLIPLLLLFTVILGCKTTADVNTGSPLNSDATSATSDHNIVRNNLDKEIECNKLKVKLAEVAIQDDRITLGLTVTNPTEDKRNFYPDQKSAVVGNKQLDANMFQGKGDLSGEIQPGVSKSGSIVYMAKGFKLTPNEVKQIRFDFGDIYDSQSYKSQPCEYKAELSN